MTPDIEVATVAVTAERPLPNVEADAGVGADLSDDVSVARSLFEADEGESAPEAYHSVDNTFDYDDEDDDEYLAAYRNTPRITPQRLVPRLNGPTATKVSYPSLLFACCNASSVLMHY